MRIAISGGRSALGRALVAALGAEHQVVVVPEGDLRDEAFARQAVVGAEALIHLAPLSPDGLGAGDAAPDLPGDAAAEIAAGMQARERLDLATRGTFVLLNAAVAAGVRRVVLGSTLSLFERYPATWSVAESWRPLPDPMDVAQLSAYLAEETVKQFPRVEPIVAICLRFGEIVDDAMVAGQRYDPRWVHLDDAMQACRQALTVLPEHGPAGQVTDWRQGWWVYHIVGGGAATRWPLAHAADEQTLHYQPQHSFADHEGAGEPLVAMTEAEAQGDLSLLGPRAFIPSQPIRKVVIFGAGGPLAAATAQALANSYTLRLTDVRPIADIAAQGKPQSPGAPLPQVLGAPHETQVVDVSDYAQVYRACAGMDAIINCSVVRPHPVQAFLVNTIGAYNVARAAVAHRIRRVVHTGPQSVSSDRPAGYAWDFDVPNDAPFRPGTWLYGISKYLGIEAVRLFAEDYDLRVPALLFSSFLDAATATRRLGGVGPMTVSWEDSGLAMRHALEAPDLPAPLEVFHILSDLPHRKYSNEKARRLLGWQPRDRLVNLWARR